MLYSSQNKKELFYNTKLDPNCEVLSKCFNFILKHLTVMKKSSNISLEESQILCEVNKD